MSSLERAVAFSEICNAVQHLEDALVVLQDLRAQLESAASGPWSTSDLAMRQARALHDLEAVVMRQQDTLDQLAQRVSFLERPVPREVVMAEPEYGAPTTTGLRMLRGAALEPRGAAEPDMVPLPIEDVGVSP